MPDAPRLLHRFHERARERRIPLSISFELTHYCNLNCAHCYVVRHGRPHPNELTTDEVRDALDQLAEAGTLSVTFTGGEILTRSDWLGILTHARENNFSIQIITNGTLLGPAELDLLAEVAPWEVSVSLYSDSAEIHDQVVGVERAFAKTMRAIELLRERGPEDKDQHLADEPELLALPGGTGAGQRAGHVAGARSGGVPAE